ncbi:MAG: hypothetical protein ACXWID_19500 [Pyrinomonadaceae bacterium]
MKRVALFSFLAVIVLVGAGDVFAQPAGGKTTTTETKSKTNSSSSTPKPTKPTTPASLSSKRPNSAPASIDGKWWTSGNDFGASEVVFTQSGASVTGTIQYSDGATGTVNGTMVGKRLQFTFADANGRTGSGWLELSWNNFLGGPWRNTRVRDGSWTLMRVEGKWCFGGSRNRIRTATHNARGDLLVVTEDGTRNGGRLEGPWIFMTSDDGVTIKGDFDFRGNRVNWSTGFFWTWCGRN